MRWKKIYHGISDQNKVEVAILISYRADFNASNIIRDTEGHYIMIKKSIVQEDKLSLNVYVPNNRISKYMRPN